MADAPLLLTSKNITSRMQEQMRARFEVAFLDDWAGFAAFAAEHGQELRAMTPPGHDRVDGAVMDMFPNLGIISNFGVGYDSIDAMAAAERGIIVSHTPDVLNDEVANTAIMLFLAVHRDMVAQDGYVRDGSWERLGNAPLTRGIAGQKVGLLGMGRIGQAIAEKLGVFGVEVLYHTRNRRDLPYRYCDDLVEMARELDTLIVITPGGPETHHLVNAEVINALGPRGALINIARGSVVDEPALITALQSGKLGAAGLDVFENEPHVPDALVRLPNTVLLPHVGSATVETRQAMGDLVCDNLISWLDTGKAVCPVPECAHL